MKTFIITLLFIALQSLDVRAQSPQWSYRRLGLSHYQFSTIELVGGCTNIIP